MSFYLCLYSFLFPKSFKYGSEQIKFLTAPKLADPLNPLYICTSKVPLTFTAYLESTIINTNPPCLYQAKKMNCLLSWPEPVIRVQSLAESGMRAIPERYIKPLSDRPSLKSITTTTNNNNKNSETSINIPVIDLQNLFSNDQSLRDETMSLVSQACTEWGFFQILNHGVSHELMKRARETWREFFSLPLDEKQEYANLPNTYEGYGSRLGVEKGAILDWSDYFFLHYMPPSLRNQSKWPALPPSCRYVPGVHDSVASC